MFCGEENKVYTVANKEDKLNPGSEGKHITQSAEECRLWCKNEYPGQAERYTWNRGTANIPERKRNACFCKKKIVGAQLVYGYVSGLVDCEHITEYINSRPE